MEVLGRIEATIMKDADNCGSFKRVGIGLSYFSLTLDRNLNNVDYDRYIPFKVKGCDVDFHISGEHEVYITNIDGIECFEHFFQIFGMDHVLSRDLNKYIDIKYLKSGIKIKQ